MKTFIDDPLRILRAIRFAGRFHFIVHTDILQSASINTIQHDLNVKVSRERIGIEIHKMLMSKKQIIYIFIILLYYLHIIILFDIQYSPLSHSFALDRHAAYSSFQYLSDWNLRTLIFQIPEKYELNEIIYNGQKQLLEKYNDLNSNDVTKLCIQTMKQASEDLLKPENQHLS